MEQTHSLPKAVRFGVFEADLGARELRKNVLRLKLPEQPFQILSMLLAKPGEIVLRREGLSGSAGDYRAASWRTVWNLGNQPGN